MADLETSASSCLNIGGLYPPEQTVFFMDIALCGTCLEFVVQLIDGIFKLQSFA